MEIQTRSFEGAILNFGTFKEALDFANSSWEHILGADSPRCVWKISFPLPTGERIRLVRTADSKDWIIRQMDDEIKELEELSNARQDGRFIP